MMKTRYARISATTAIAAALALSPAVAAAQDVGGSTDTSTTTTTTTDSTPAPPASEPAATDTAAPADTSSAEPAAAPVKHVTRSTTTRTTRVSKQTVAPVHAAPVAAAAPVVTVPVAPATAPAPVASEVAVTPAAPPPAAPANNAPADDTALELGAGAVGILALGGIAFALARRRRDDEVIDEYDSYEPVNSEVDQPADELVTPVATAEPMPATPGRVTSTLRASPAAAYFADRPAFNWNEQATGTAAVEQADDRRPGETWVERAHRGPSADNPSLSLKKRLKRAAFFDKRDREVAEGRAAPVDPDAGLPETLIEEQDLQAA